MTESGKKLKTVLEGYATFLLELAEG